ncbi:MAG TPA: glycosyltransferase [Methylomirabilota bacterium]|jgi:hypothetical protein|nr:glycosyltransferase [Methylomirabilota bacterium]
MARIIVASGFVAQYPQGGGVFSVVLQYVRGLRRLGHEVCWLELLWPQGANDQALIRTFIERMVEFGLQRECCLLYLPQGKWPDAGSQQECHGMGVKEFNDYCRTTDLLLDLCASVRLPDLLATVRRAALLDLDPGFMQLWMQQWDMGQRHYDLFFTVGQNIGRSGCPMPTGGVQWRTFCPPVDVALWQAGEGDAEAPFSTVSQWWGYPPIYYQGEVYEGSKRTEFLRFIDLPALSRHPFELALNLDPVKDLAERQLLLERGWRVHDAHVVVGDFASYRRYIQRACGEFSVAKPGYIKSKSGWFSDRSACYLAAGRPVMVQETAFSAFLPTGRGIVSFTTLEEAVEGVKEIKSNYAQHCRAAHEIAQEYFSAEKVLRQLLCEAGL